MPSLKWNEHPAWHSGVVTSELLPEDYPDPKLSQSTQALNAGKLAEPEQPTVGNWSTAHTSYTMNPIPICKNCKHYERDGVFDKCNREKKWDPVTGNTVIAHKFCDIERKDSPLKDERWCGYTARYYEYAPPEKKKWWKIFT